LIKTHYCLVCKEAEVCSEKDCDYRELFNAHGYCYGKANEKTKKYLDQVADRGLSADDKKTDSQERRKVYTKEYNKQWNKDNEGYHQRYRLDNPEVVKKASLKYSRTEKGKQTRKKYEDKTKVEKAKYMKNYMKSYRQLQKDKKNINAENVKKYILQRQPSLTNPNSLFNPPIAQRKKKSISINPNFSSGLGIGIVPRQKTRVMISCKMCLQRITVSDSKDHFCKQCYSDHVLKSLTPEETQAKRNAELKAIIRHMSESTIKNDSEKKKQVLTVLKSEIEKIEIKLLEHIPMQERTELKKRLIELKIQRKKLRGNLT